MPRPSPASNRFLAAGDPEPVLIHGAGRHSPFLLLCDHAGNTVPARLDTLGLTGEQLRDHIAWDPNAWDQTMELADLLGAKAIGQRYSRLVIDCNRRLDAADSIAEVSDGVIVPANQGLSLDEKRRRAEAILVPYHRCIETELRRYGASDPVCIVSMHTFTPRLAGGRQRPWEIGVMSGPDDRMRRKVVALLDRLDTGLTVGDNEPYVIKMDEIYTLPIHAEEAGLPYVQFELRNDMFGEPAARASVCRLLAQVIRQAFDDVKQENPPAGRA